ncbi:DUF6128 domain-containing protein [Anaerocolumna chitinilytica]|uniref:DUF6128 domain-containing protein n=1 Tax=Anaerocolumna chitinilytica TaxID=1727145 RepID=A0A7M3SB69_9FIRM|nr:DUF6128 domain-containing protein [Anaerocolumna chitinilytica]BCK01837.1 hypothetical protein bsdcttw_48770 [Anaerocolumna chitinilytica]
MADYKRQVSYIYLYEEGKKKNNIGYARVEAKNGQCKYTIHITALGLNEKQLKVYAFRRRNAGIEGILLGTVLVKNNTGDFKIITDVSHIMNSPYGMNDMGGIVLLFSERKFFATEWDSKPITMAMVANIDRKEEKKPERAADREKEETKGMKAANLAEVLFEHAKAPKETETIPPVRETVRNDKSLKDLLTPNLNISLDKKPESDTIEEERVLDDFLRAKPAAEPDEMKKVGSEPQKAVPDTENVTDVQKRTDNNVKESENMIETENNITEALDNIEIQKNVTFVENNQETAGYTADAENNQETAGYTADAENNQETAGYTADAENNQETAGYTADAENNQETAGYAAEAENNQETAGYAAEAEDNQETAGYAAEAEDNQETAGYAAETENNQETAGFVTEAKNNIAAEDKVTEINKVERIEEVEPPEELESTLESEKEATPDLRATPVFEDHPLAKQIYHNFPKMYPFEDNEIAWCARIEPKDIGMLPMELWGLGNNSFLLHGYYSYRHLIFARVNDKTGQNYILGVPGIYHNREKFMAKMFGFENFKCAKKKPQRTGEFGYWYIPVLLNRQG